MVCGLAPASLRGCAITTEDRDPGGSSRNHDEIARDTNARCKFGGSTDLRVVAKPLPRNAKFEEGQNSLSRGARRSVVPKMQNPRA